MAIKNTNISPLLSEGTGIVLTSSGQVITITSTGAGALPAGSDTQVQFNDGGTALGADSSFTFNKTLNVLGLESIDFALTPTATTAERRLLWDNDEGSLNLTLKGGLTDIALGAEVAIMCYNAEATTLNKGEVVYLWSSQGQRPAVKRASNSAESTSSKTFGMVAENISAGSNGFVMQMGIVRNIDTNAYTEGDTLYLGSTAGSVTITKPSAPSHMVFVGVVLKKNATSGRIFVKPTNGFELTEIHDVALSSVTNNDFLVYETSSSLWKNKSISTILGYTPEQPLTFSAPLSRSTNTISIPVATSSANGYLSSSDWSTFSGKQNALSGSGIVKSTSGTISYLTDNTTNWDTAYTNRITSLTTTGSSGASTLVSNTLNIPNYTLAGLGGFANPMTTLGDVIYGGASGLATRLAGNTTTTKQFLSQTGTGTISAIPAWSVVSKSDVGLGSVENTALSTWAGSTNITTLGTIATGTWSASTIGVDKGGTGATTLTGILVGSGTSAITAVAGTASQLLRRNAGNTAYEFFTPSYLTSAITSLGGLTASTQTFANDTNVTITSATSTHTLGWSGQLSIARGGTGASTATTAFDALSPTTTLGDTIYHNGTDNVRLAGNTTTTKQYLSQTGNGTISASPSWATISGSDITGSALTKTDDTNVTLTLGGTPATSLLRATSLTLGWTGQLAVSRGGTGLSALGTALQLIRVNSGATALEYFTPTYLTSAITSLNTLTSATQTFATGTSGTDFGISSVTSTHTFNLPTASATNRGALSSGDWTTFNSKQSTITLTTTGSSGASTFVSNTLNIPTYTLAGLGGLSNPMTTLGDMIYGGASGASTRLIGQTTTAKQYLSQTGTGTASAIPVWATIAFADVSGTLGIGAGGTGQTTAVAAFDALAPTTTLGDIIFYNGTDNVRLAGNITATKQFLSQTGTGTISASPSWSAVSKTDVGLANVENTALSTWAGSTNITTLGTIATGTWSGTAISAIKGGTGQTGYAIGDLLYADTTTSLAKLADIATGSALISGGVSTAPSWGKIGLTTHISGTLAVGNGGTGTATAPTQWGVIYASTTSAYASTGAGTTGNVLVATTSSAPSWVTLDMTYIPDAVFKKSARVATTGSNITLAGGAPTTLDGVTLSLNDRILVKDQTLSAQNGVYYVSTLGTGANGTWTRVTDADTISEIGGAVINVDSGTSNGGKLYKTFIKTTDTLGTTNMPFYEVTTSLTALSNPMTTQGDIIYGGASGVPTRLGIGTANQLLRTNAGATAPEWFTPTYLTSAITSLGGLTASTQTFATGTTGTDFNISSATSTHTFNIPTASATNRGLLSTSDWSSFNSKLSLDANGNLSVDNLLSGYTSTATAAGTTTLTVGSTYQQYFTGTTTQTVVLPVVSTLVNGFSFKIINLSTGIVTVNTSGGNTIQAMSPSTELNVYVLNITGGTTTAPWNWTYGSVKSSNIAATIAGATTANALAKFNSTGGLIADSNITDNGSVIQILLPVQITGGFNNGYVYAGPVSHVSKTWLGLTNTTLAFFSISYGGASTGLGTNYDYIANPIFASSVTESSSGTHNLISQLAIQPITITDGVATTTNAATLYIEGPATGTATITNNYALWIDSGVTRLDGTAIINTENSVTNTVLEAGYFQRSLTTGTPAVGIGTAFGLYTQTGASTYKNGARIASISNNVTSGSENFDLVFYNLTGGVSLAERFRIKANGSYRFNAYTSASSFTGTATASLMVNSSGDVITESPVLQETNLTIITGSVLTAFTTPITLVPAQGAGTVIVPVAFIFKLNYALAPFATNTSYQFQIGTTAVSTSQTFGGSTSSYTMHYPANVTGTATANLANQALVWKVLTGNPTGGGTSTISIGCIYSVLTI